VAILWITSGTFTMATQSVSLSWNPTPDTNVTGYALYVGHATGNYSSRVDVGTNVTCTLSGLSNGATYYFVSTAYNSAQVESPPSNEAQFIAPSNNPPVLNPITNFNVAALGELIITNRATDSAQNVVLTYSFVGGAPTNMVINPTNGLIDWLVPLSYGGTTNTVTVQVADNGVPPATASQSFTITVSNYVQISFGPSIVALGQTSSVPVIFNSSVPITNLSFTLDVPGTRMSNLSMTSAVPAVATVSQSTKGAAHSVVTINAVSGQAIQGPVILGLLSYKAVANVPSSFACLYATNIVAVQSNGVLVPTTVNGRGQAVLIGSQSLAQVTTLTNGQHNLIVYGPVGTNYQVQSKTGFTGAWTNESASAVIPTNMFVTFTNIPPAVVNSTSANATKLYRTHAM
jgi:hypothetical protein